MNVDRILNVVLLVVVIALIATVMLGRSSGDSDGEVVRLQAELETLRGVNETLASQNRELEQTREMLQTSNDLLEQAAREDLGFIKDGEIVVVLPK